MSIPVPPTLLDAFNTSSYSKSEPSFSDITVTDEIYNELKQRALESAPWPLNLWAPMPIGSVLMCF